MESFITPSVPFAERRIIDIKLFTSEKVTDTITRIRAFSGEQMYLVEGTKKAVLVDAGTGVGDLRTYIL